MKTASAVALAALCCALSTAQAQGPTIGLHLVSQHWPSKGQNNVNPGLYVRNAEGWVAGTYRNSERKQSWYVGRDFEYGRFGLRLGLVTGYRVAPVAPLAAATVRVSGGFVLAFVPPVDKHSGVVHLVYEFK